MAEQKFGAKATHAASRNGKTTIKLQKPARAQPFRGSFFAGLNALAQFCGRQAVDFCNN
jgi:hypothetical protein